MLGKDTISFDLDDTLNWMSKQLAFAAGMTHIPRFDDIKAGNAPASFYESRARLFPDPTFWANQPKCKHADEMIAMTRDAGLKPIICTKTPMKEGMNPIASAKIVWQQENFPDVDMLIATGQKHADSNGLVDDSYKNCMTFNRYSEWYRPCLVWNNAKPDLDALESFLRLARNHDIAHKYKTDTVHAALTVVKALDTGRIAVISRFDNDETGLPCGMIEANETPVVAASRELFEETGLAVVEGLTESFILKDLDTVVHCFYGEVESETELGPEAGFEDECYAEWEYPVDFIAGSTDRYYDFNNVLLYNLNLL